MRNLKMFQFKSIVVNSPDDLCEAMDTVTCVDSGRVLITRLANHLTGNETTDFHIKHACYLLLIIGDARNPYIVDAVTSIW